MFLIDVFKELNIILLSVKSVNFYGPKSDFVVSGSDCGHIYIWDKNTEAIVQRKHADANGIVIIYIFLFWKFSDLIFSVRLMY